MIGQALGPYQVLSKLGEGGMGEVYRARDPRLHREVAIKILPDIFAHQSERVTRFEREAQLLAALNHPHIAQIFGLEDAGGVRALVMELVPGRSLADAIPAGGLPLAEALDLARQIGAGLEAAHEKGIIHRDLKPGNVMVTPDGHVKVLDFGLGKALERESEGDATNSPTITAATHAGMLLGTAAYMAPEQAKGRAADKRSDIWAFGAVLYEMLSGKRAFEGEDVSETLAAILRGEPDWTALPAGVPPHVRRVLQQCLHKDRKRRFRDVGDVLLALDQPDAPPIGRGDRVWKTVALAAAAAFVMLVMLVVAVAVRGSWPVRTVAGQPAPLSVNIALPPDTSLMMIGKTLAIAPDGLSVAYIGEQHGTVALYRRDLASFENTAVAGTGEARSGVTFSPDGQRLLFVASTSRIIAIPARGGATTALCVGQSGSIAWLDESSFVFSTGGLMRSPVANCAPEPLTTIDEGGLSAHRWPEAVPGSTMVLFTDMRTGRPTPKIMAVDRNTRQVHEVVDGTSARFAPPDRLFFVRRRQDVGTAQLFVAPFDAATGKVTGTPAVVADELGLDSVGGAQYDVSTNGTLVYAPPIQPVVRILARNGDVQASFPVAPDADMIAVSPDGSRAVLTFDSRMELLDLVRGVTDRLSAAAGQYKFPAWLGDSKRISYRYLAPDSTSYEVRLLDLAHRTTELVLNVPSDPEAGGISAWSPDGKTAFGNYHGPNGSHDVFRVLLDGPRALEPVIATPGLDANARLSPDGRLLAFVGILATNEVFVQPVQGGERIRVSTNGAIDPNWAPDGLNLYYRAGSRIFSAAITMTAGRIVASEPRLVAERPLSFYGRLWSYGILPDGRLVTLEPAAPVSSLRAVLNGPR